MLIDNKKLKVFKGSGIIVIIWYTKTKAFSITATTKKIIIGKETI